MIALYSRSGKKRMVAGGRIAAVKPACYVALSDGVGGVIHS